MSTLEIVVALLQGTHVAALVSLFGTLVFLTLVVPAAMAEATVEALHLQRRLLRFARISAAYGAHSTDWERHHDDHSCPESSCRRRLGKLCGERARDLDCEQRAIG